MILLAIDQIYDTYVIAIYDYEKSSIICMLHCIIMYVYKCIGNHYWYTNMINMIYREQAIYNIIHIYILPALASLDQP